VFRKLALQKESRIEESHLMLDHVHNDLDPTEVRGFAGGRLYQGQECDPPGPDVRREEAQLRGTAFLGQSSAIPSFFEIKESGGVRALSEKNLIVIF
jgi:hypothetical protein